MQKTWRTNSYYVKAHKASLDTKYLGMKMLKKYAEGAKKILDVGCGDGTRLNYIVGKNQNGYGVDVSSKAIELAKKYKKFELKKYDGNKLPYKDEEFDLVYSAFVLEHINKPTRFMNEMIRVLKKNDYLVLMSPNYGSPNRSSPPFKGSRLKKLLFGFINDMTAFTKDDNKLKWENIDPITEQAYEMDYDTTIEPYSRSLVMYLKNKAIDVLFFSCGWEYELPNAKFHQKVFRFFANLGIYPFVYWGPHIIIVGRKNG